MPRRTQVQASPQAGGSRAGPEQSHPLPLGIVGDDAETGSLERRFPRLQAGNSAASVAGLDLERAAQIQPQSPSLGPT